jgi:hypothetical protein
MVGSAESIESSEARFEESDAEWRAVATRRRFGGAVRWGK